MRGAFIQELDTLAVDELTALKTMIDEKLQRANGPTKYASEAQIYKCIWRENQEIVYIGSTCEARHTRAHAHVHTALTKPEMAFHRFIVENGGPENFEFSLLRHVSCKTREELLTEEEDEIQDYKPRCNVHYAGTGLSRPRSNIAVQNIPAITASTFADLSSQEHNLRKIQRLSLKKYVLQTIFGSFLTNSEMFDDFFSAVVNDSEKERWLTTAVCLLDDAVASRCLALLRAAKFTFANSEQFERAECELHCLPTLARCLGLQSAFDADTLVDKSVLIQKHDEIMPLLLTVRSALGIQSNRVPENGPGFRTLYDRLDSVFKYLLGFKCVNTLEGRFKRTRIEGRMTALGLYRWVPVDPFAERLHTIIRTLQAENATMRTPIVTV